MTDIARLALVMAYAYLMGAVPTAYLVARWARGIDIRSYGSGNVGASNLARHTGKRHAVVVATFDVMVKGTGSVALARALELGLEHQAIVGLLAAVGHNWSVYLRFSGGRGLTVAAGGLLVLAWKELLALLGVAFVGWLVFRNTALWFGIALVLLPFWALAFREPSTVVLYCIGVLVLSMLKRLISNPGTAPPSLRWRDMVIPRLLYDRDILKEEDWVSRTPDGDVQREGE